MPPRRVFTGVLLAAGSLAGSVLYRRRAARRRERIDLYADDGSMVSLDEDTAEASRLLPLAGAIRDAAYLEGDFVLRSGRRSSYYLDKYRFGTDPDLLRPLGEAIAREVREREPEATRIAAPELGAVSLAAAASLAAGLPFVIVRKDVKAYGTANRIEGAFDEAETVCLVEDVVTSGGAAVAAVRALRDEGLRVSVAVCVVDREEGGVDELARHGVRLWPLLRASELVAAPAKAHG